MKDRIITTRELDSIYEKNLFPQDVLDSKTIGVSDSSECALLIEDKKIEGAVIKEMEQKFNNLKEAENGGMIWILPLEAYNISHLLLNDDTFFDNFCDKKGDPYVLSKRIALRCHPNCYWSEDIYLQAFEND